MTENPFEDSIFTLAMRANVPYTHQLGHEVALNLKFPPHLDPKIPLDSPEGQHQAALIEAAANGLANVVHSDNVRRGWWNVHGTNEFNVHRNVGEMLMLMVTEIDEAVEANFTGASDDKLPAFSGVTVELADALIRMLDLAGRFCPDFGKEFARISLSPECFTQRYHRLWDGVSFLAQALEKHRKGAPFDAEAATFCVWIFRLAHHSKLPICEAFVAKRAYNSKRADHDPVNRVKPGGKAF